MAFVPAPNIIRLEVIGVKALQKVENVIHIDCFHQPTVADANAIITACANSIAAAWPARLPTDTTINTLRCTSLHQANDFQVEQSFTVPQVGTGIGQPLPNEVSFCVSLRSNSIGRSARGRLYWLGLHTNQITGNSVTSVEAGLIRDAVEAFRQAIVSVGFAWVIVSRFANKVPRPGGPVYFVVTSVRNVDLIVDSQRRRRPGIGV